MAELHVLRETSLLDIPATLRRWADDIEAGEHGNVSGCVIVLDADKLAVGYMGSGEAAPNTCLLMNAAIAFMIAPVLEAKG
jgi:hypothetical protein